MKKYCYFCKGTNQKVNPWIGTHSTQVTCKKCSLSEYETVTTFFIDNTPKYVDIKVEKNDNTMFIFTLYLTEQCTTFSQEQAHAPRAPLRQYMSIAGLPINPSNARQKLNLYLLFS